MKLLEKKDAIFVMFHDKGEYKGARTYYKESYDKKKFEEMNKKGRGIYFAVNDFKQDVNLAPRKTRRQAEYLEKLIAVYGDLDIAKSGDATTEETRTQRKKELKKKIIEFLPPTYIIETKNGLQPLRRIRENKTDEETITKYKKCIEGIIERSRTNGCHADQVKDVARILRVPGYYHQKKEPYLIEMIHELNLSYTLDEIYRKVESYIPKQENYEKKINNDVEKIRQIQEIENLDFQQVIIKAFGAVGRSASFDSKARLILDGRLTGTFQGKKDDKDYLASTSHEPFSGNKITAVSDILAISNKEAYRRLLKEFNIKTETELKTKIPKKVKEKEEYNTFGLLGIDKAFGMPTTKDLVMIAGYPSSGKTEFAYFMARKNSLKKKIIYFALELSEESMKNRMARNYAGISKYDKQVGAYTEQQKVAMERKLQDLNNYKNIEYMSYEQPPNIEEILECIQAKEKEGVELFFIDAIGNIGGPENEITRLGEITRILRLCCSNLGVCIVLIHHMNKPQKQDLGMPGGVAKIRGTQKLLDDCTIVCEVWRDTTPEATPEEKRVVEFHQYKDTMGGTTGTIYLEFVKGEYQVKLEQKKVEVKEEEDDDDELF